MDWVRLELEKLERDGLMRSTTAWPRKEGRVSLPGGGTLVDFSSNDYLDLANDPRVKARAAEAVDRFGCSASASRLMSGTIPLHEELEAELAQLVGMESALLFGSGFQMNVGVLSALAGRDDAIFSDRLNHASLVDGARLCGAMVKRFPHNDADALARLLGSTKVRGRRIVVCESVFSMDGDIAPLRGIAGAARAHGALLLVDEAHALGVFGEGGGVCMELGETARPDIVLGTLGKALGSFGGFAACSGLVRRLLVNRARSFVYSTALPPASAAAALAAVKILGEEPELGRELLRRAGAFHGLLLERGFRMPEFASQILPLHVGDNAAAMAFAGKVREAGLLAVAIRPPTVPAGTSRLRLSVTLAHSQSSLMSAADAIAAAGRESGLVT